METASYHYCLTHGLLGRYPLYLFHYFIKRQVYIIPTHFFPLLREVSLCLALSDVYWDPQKIVYTTGSLLFFQLKNGNSSWVTCMLLGLTVLTTIYTINDSRCGLERLKSDVKKNFYPCNSKKAQI